MPGKRHSEEARLVRFGVSIEAHLLETFDGLIARRGYRNRSEAIRDLIRARIVGEEWHAGTREVVGTLTLIYDHHTRELQARMTELQHEFEGRVVSSLHVHLDRHNCLEVIVVRGRPSDVRALADGLVSLKGVKHGQLAATTSGKMIG